ncbi:MAG: hypothetical protein VKN72_24810 [Nostocales cyanobacterium 94392]|nr:hypothetical protein [Nostocales cyanobacterium 94392]
MAKTPVDLYRRGSANSPKMDNVRPDKDVAVYEDNNEIWVMETLRQQSSGGISTFAKLGKGKKLVEVKCTYRYSRRTRINW